MLFKNKIASIILLATLFRCIIACSIGLGNDEVYYVTYAQHLQWNYFDHPPLVALLIRLTTFNLAFTNEFFIRLGPILLAAANTYLIYQIGKKIKDERTGLFAALLYNSSIYSSIIAGVFIMPDAPQLFFWMVSLYLLTAIITNKESQTKSNLHLIFFGLATGLCVMSKIHGIFLWLGFGLYILIYNRKLLSNGYLYVSVLLTLLIISPILFWNIENDFITYTFHSNRVSINHGMNPNSFIREFFGGLAYNNPINYFIIVTTLIACWKNKIKIDTNYIRLLLLMSLPLIGILLFVSLFRDTLPHWSGPGYTALILLSATYLSDLKTDSLVPKLVHYANYLIIVVSCIGILFISFYPGTLGKTNEEKLGKGDVTLDMYDWSFFKTEVEKIIQQNKAKGTTNTEFIINNKWFPAAHIDNYIVQPLHLHFIAIGKLEDIHTYHWLNQLRKPIQKGDDAYYITVSNNFSDPNEIYKDDFAKINPPVIIKQYRGGKPVRNMLVYLMEEFKN
ncbi:ArnT family glycosyltransferase [Flavobacterium flavipallidum]|uniref:Glycosyltransferase family 39 protein n=1 Tax=Flavobacterium flavipallidum TaxID=3139140 RepID=A0ABU9HHR0_9FLAO